MENTLDYVLDIALSDFYDYISGSIRKSHLRAFFKAKIEEYIADGKDYNGEEIFVDDVSYAVYKTGEGKLISVCVQDFDLKDYIVGNFIYSSDAKREEAIENPYAMSTTDVLCLGRYGVSVIDGIIVDSDSLADELVKIFIDMYKVEC